MMKRIIIIAVILTITAIVCIWNRKHHKTMAITGLIGVLVSIASFVYLGEDAHIEIKDSVNTFANEFSNDINYHDYSVNYFGSDVRSDVETLLRQAELHYERDDIEKVIDIYANSLLTDNPVALCNLGFLYESGELPGGLERACEYYAQVDTDYGKLHLLKAYIMMPENDKSDEIWELMHELWDTNQSVRDYFMYCNFDCSEKEYWANHPDDSTASLSKYTSLQWVPTNIYYIGSVAPAGNNCEQWVVFRIDYVDSHTEIQFRKFVRSYLDILDSGFVRLDCL